MQSVATKLVQVMQACGYIQKDAENKEQKYKYTAAAAVMRKVNPALVEAKLISIPEFTVISEKEKTTSKGGVWQIVTVQCKLQIVDAESGESITITSLGTGTDPGDKAVAKAQTMALKYAWLTALNIETGDEPEADERTDQAEFTNQPAVNPMYNQLYQQWQQMGWDVNTLPHYLSQRFQKPYSQLTDVELTTMINEANNYLQQRMV